MGSYLILLYVWLLRGSIGRRGGQVRRCEGFLLQKLKLGGVEVRKISGYDIYWIEWHRWMDNDGVELDIKNVGGFGEIDF